jgi:hypothetical protein
MEELLTWKLEDVPPEQAMLVWGAIAGAGALYCFFGYRLLKFILGLTGFLLAGSVAAVLVGFLSYGNVPGMAIGLVIGGICGAMALFFLYKTGIFCVGMLGAILVAYNLLHNRPEPWILWAVAGLGLVGGLLAILVERPIMTLATSAIGAMMLTQAGLTFARDFGLLDSLPERVAEFTGPLPEFAYLTYGVLATWGLLTLLGALFQFRLGRKRKAAESP